MGDRSGGVAGVRRVGKRGFLSEATRTDLDVRVQGRR